MKKISRLIALFILLTSFGVPLSALAACPIGYTTDLSNSANCVPDSTSYAGPQPVPNTPSSPTAGRVNQEWLVYYYNTILWAVNSILVPVLMAIAFIVFLWGIFKYFIWAAENESEKAEGRKFAMWGIIGFVIIMSVWGIVNIVKSTVIPTTAGSTRPNYPTL